MNAKEKIVARIAEYDKRIAIRQNNSCYHDETEAVKSFDDRAHGLEQALVILAECEKDKNLVEVVRCGDCRYKDTEDCPATERRMYRNNIGVIKEFLETWCGMEFCSNGKRRAE